MVIKKGFTLAEIMIVLAVIGVLTAILLPTAIHSIPNENIMKFKKANATLYKVISELVNSDKYYLDGDLGTLADGSLAGKTAFCESFADIVSTKKKVCDYEAEAENGFDFICVQGAGKCVGDKADFIDNFDIGCEVTEQSLTTEDVGVLTTDGIYYFEQNLDNFFGCLNRGDTNTCAYTDGSAGDAGKRLFGYDSPYDYMEYNGIKTLILYKRFCIDVDGINQGEDPFGYGIRCDGKIVPGNRAKEWIQKSIQEKD